MWPELCILFANNDIMYFYICLCVTDRRSFSLTSYLDRCDSKMVLTILAAANCALLVSIVGVTLYGSSMSVFITHAFVVLFCWCVIVVNVVFVHL